MKIAIRVDASDKIGSGHVMRCLALAEELKNRGAEILFISRPLPGHLCAWIVKEDYPVECLTQRTLNRTPFSSPNEEWLGVSVNQDIQETIDVLSSNPVDWIVVDHYALDLRWERAVRTYTRCIMSIDDLANRSHDCNLLLDQNLYPNMTDRYKDFVPLSCRMFLGPSYALLRDEFRQVRRSLRPRDGTLRKLLVAFGGVDASNESGKSLRAIRALNHPYLHVDVVLGYSNFHTREIEHLCKSLPDATLHQPSNRMAELMDQADLAIGGGGIMSWERCCVGLPSLIIALADNQKPIAEGCHQAMVGLYLGYYTDVSEKDICKTLENLFEKPELLKTMHEKSLRLVDGQGTEKIANILYALSEN